MFVPSAIDMHPKSFVTATGLTSDPNTVALGIVAGKVLINLGTHTYRSFVLSGLMSSEFLQHLLNISLRSLFTAEIMS